MRALTVEELGFVSGGFGVFPETIPENVEVPGVRNPRPRGGPNVITIFCNSDCGYVDWDGSATSLSYPLYPLMAARAQAKAGNWLFQTLSQGFAIEKWPTSMRPVRNPASQ